MSEHEIFVAAIKLTGDERTAFLEVACGNDQQLRQQVDALLRAHEESGGILPDHDDRTTRHFAIHAEPGMLVGGRYKLLEAVGEGGMGTVWIAEQREPVKRKVAIKLVKAGMDSRQVLAHFDAERQALALMDHPNIAKVFDGGVTEQGRPFFVMEFVKGVPLTDYCDQARLSLKERLNLFIPVCQAVQHAHQKGIIHRDLKPSNILVCLYDGQPVPKVIDFGLAKALHQSLTEDTLHTALGTMVGTPLYMSPEQAEHNNLDVDTRTDIYSLGVILYELLTGTTPLERQQLKLAAYNEILRLIKEVEPPKPSVRMSGSASLPSVAAQRSIEPKQLSRSLTGDLDWIVMKSLEKERSRRYETASSFAADIQHYLAFKPVSAGPPSTAYYLRKWIHRHRRPVIAVSFVILSLIAGVIGTGVGLSRAITAEQEAIESADLARESEKKAIESEAQMLENFRESTDDTIRLLIGEKQEIGPREREYLERTLQRWQKFSDKQADDERGRAYRAEGHQRIGAVWDSLGRKEEANQAYVRARDIRRELVTQFPTVEEYQSDLAATHVALASLFLDRQFLDRQDAAIAQEEYKAARAIYLKLIERFATVATFQQQLAKNHNQVGFVLRKQGDGEGARSEMTAARDVQKRLVSQFPRNREYQQELADYHMALGIVLYQLLEDYTAARVEFQSARDIHKNLVATFAEGLNSANPKHLEALATSHLRLSGLTENGEEAIAEMEAACEVHGKLVELFPMVPEYQYSLALVYLNLGNTLSGTANSIRSRKEHDTALKILRKLVDEYPSVSKYRIALGSFYSKAAHMRMTEGDTITSLELYQKAIDFLIPIHHRDPSEDQVRQELRRSFSGKATILTCMNQHDEANKVWEKAFTYCLVVELPATRIKRTEALIRSDNYLVGVAELDLLVKQFHAGGDTAAQWKHSNDLYKVACMYALASPKMGDRQAEYADLAMEWLQNATRADISPQIAGDIAIDPDLNPLRDREDFRELLKSMATPQSNSAPPAKTPAAAPSPAHGEKIR